MLCYVQSTTSVWHRFSCFSCAERLGSDGKWSEVQVFRLTVCLMTAKCTSERNSREMPEYPDSDFCNTSARKLSTLVSENTGLLQSDVMSPEEQTLLCQAMKSLMVWCDVTRRADPLMSGNEVLASLWGLESNTGLNGRSLSVTKVYKSFTDIPNSCVYSALLLCTVFDLTNITRKALDDSQNGSEEPPEEHLNIQNRRTIQMIFFLIMKKNFWNFISTQVWN